eukprot:8927298-Pyramimonas_sp.AAC.1
MKPPQNGWRHFRNYEKPNIHISGSESQFFYLMLLKPIYGTVGAPLLWQLVLTMFVKKELKGIQSVFDDNFFTWVENGIIKIIWTMGKIKRHCLPFTHMGMTYELHRGRHLLIHQDKFVDGLSKVDISKARQSKPKGGLTPEEVHQLRSGICSLLWLCQTREDIYCDTVQLQQYVRDARVEHIIQLNVIIGRAIRNRRLAGLHLPELDPPFRLASVADASHGNTMTSYPQEGGA